VATSKLLDFEIPGYDIIEPIGRGGMASVYRARQHTFDRNVALKILKPSLSEDDAFCQRFVMESLIVAKLNHSHIVQVYDVGEISNNYYIAMEFLSGGGLQNRLTKGLSPIDAISIIKQIASALDFVHKKNIIHRDLKPDNVMFREDEAAVLTDFGIAKETDADINLTQTGLIVGTPKYMSPEQIRGSGPTPQADIYSLGIMFYQLLCNRVPFEGADLIATAYKHFNEPVPQLPQHLSQLQGLLERMLAKNTEDRISRGKEIVDELEKIEKTSPIQRHEEETILTEAPLVESDDQATVAKPGAIETKTRRNKKSQGEQTSHPTVVDSENRQRDSKAPTVARVTNESSEDFSREEKQYKRSSAPVIYASVGAAVLAIGVMLGVFLKEDKTDPQIATTPTSNLRTTRIAVLLNEAEEAVGNFRLTKGDNNALDKYEQILRLSPNNPQALAGKHEIAVQLTALAESDISQNKLELARERLGQARIIDPKFDMSAIQQQLDSAFENRTTPKKARREFQIPSLMALAATYEKDGKLFTPPDDNAADVYRKILTMDPSHKKAREKLAELEATR